MTVRFSLMIALSFFLFSCTASSKKFMAKETRISVGSGPEDLVIDRSTGEARLLISCASKREGEAPFGEIVAFYPGSGNKDTLPRMNVPEELYFHPHGIYLDSSASPNLLYAISHEHDKNFHPIYVFEVGRDALFFKELISSELLHSPNALTLGPRGEIYICNDAGKRGSILEKMFKLRRANIVCLEKSDMGTWKGRIAAEGLGYPAGINRIGEKLYTGDAVGHLLHVYTIKNGELIPGEPVKGLKGNDNIRVVDGMLYITGHVKPFKFIAHVRSSASRSPVEVWKLNPETNEITTLYYTEGDAISAGSVAVMLDDILYIGQVFDPFILSVAF